MLLSDNISSSSSKSFSISKNKKSSLAVKNLMVKENKKHKKSDDNMGQILHSLEQTKLRKRHTDDNDEVFVIFEINVHTQFI